jgi:hypothetical protein
MTVTEGHFMKYQYYISIVPTIYSTSSGVDIRTNQYAVTSQSHLVGETSAPGIFFKYDIEPIMLIVQAGRHSFLRFLLRVVNVLSGALVAAQWGLGFLDVVEDVYGERIRKLLGRGGSGGGFSSRDTATGLLGHEKRMV